MRDEGGGKRDEEHPLAHRLHPSNYGDLHSRSRHDNSNLSSGAPSALGDAARLNLRLVLTLSIPTVFDNPAVSPPPAQSSVPDCRASESIRDPIFKINAPAARSLSGPRGRRRPSCSRPTPS